MLLLIQRQSTSLHNAVVSCAIVASSALLESLQLLQQRVACNNCTWDHVLSKTKVR